MKVFNILFPYPESLPIGKGDENSLNGFFEGMKIELKKHEGENLADNIIDNIKF